jgi:Domain of unknown function (DUF4259)
MGAWGAGIFDDDLACDVRDEFRDLIAEGRSAHEATAELERSYSDLEPDERPVVLYALAATQWRTGHIHEPTIEQALRWLDDERGLGPWEEIGEARRRRAVQRRLAGQLRKPPRAPVRIRRAPRQASPLELGDVVAISAEFGRFFAAVASIHEDRGGRMPHIKVLPFLDVLPGPDAVRAAAQARTPDELHRVEPYVLVYGEGRQRDGLPSGVELVGRGAVDQEPSVTLGGPVIPWRLLEREARRALAAYGVIDQ